ncbi:histidine--tRNA ligase [Pseudomonadales bacterium]|jgi:histidyl-tRNA synthetase|nr:histidine--tRNA ligase [Pseudomonadales bacterium]
MPLKKIKAIRGMHDITPDKSGHWARLEKAVAAVFATYAYREIRMPIVENTGLFHRSIGEVTDIVEKEMYTFADRNGESIALRPEGTAGCVRACIEHSLLDTPQKLWYNGPMFRYERPQKGRQRQFHQIGAEAFGYTGAEVEAEILLLNAKLWRVLGLEKSISLQINNIGSSEARAAYRQALVDYLNQYRSDLDADSQRRLETNPLRILDSKDAATQQLLEGAPALSAFVSQESKEHFARLNELLAAGGVEALHNPRLVRGLDYYNDTVFEWVSDELGAQGTVCGGGRYDGLVEQLGGKPTPAVGFAMGIERLYLLLEAHDFAALPGSDAPGAYVIVADPAYQAFAFEVTESLRSALPEFAIMQHLAAGSIKSQFKKADKSGAKFALVIAENEVAEQTVTIKNLHTGEQSIVSVSKDTTELAAALK